MKPFKRVVISGIIHYEEENVDEEPDAQLIDSVIGINWVHDSRLCIQTEKKEILIDVKNEPISEEIREYGDSPREMHTIR